MNLYEKYFDENCVDNIDEVLTVCNTANSVMKDRFGIFFKDPKTKEPAPKMVASIFAMIFDAIISYLEKQESRYSEKDINICNRLSIGYSTLENEDDEKQGSFVVYLRHNSIMKNLDDFNDPMMSAKEKCVQWNSENVIDQSEDIKKICDIALDYCDKLKVKFASSEFVMPIFITCYECLVNYVKVARRDNDEFEHEVNFVNCFTITARESENDLDDICITPTIDSKLKLKNDSIASAKNE